MVDFHSHIIPNIDDGSKSIDETFSMIEEAKKAGFDTIISTPHYMEGNYEIDNNEKDIWIKSLNSKLPEQKINIQLYTGNEIYLTENIINLLEGNKASTINYTSYVLFELPLTFKPLYLDDVIDEIKKRGLVPIIAHPERYSFMQEKPNLIYNLIEKGVLLQCNYGSFIGNYGVKTKILATNYLKNNMVQFLGSDAHREKTIYPKIPKILKKLKSLIGQNKLNEITTTNPKLVLSNKKISPAPLKVLRLSPVEKYLINK